MLCDPKGLDLVKALGDACEPKVPRGLMGNNFPMFQSARYKRPVATLIYSFRHLLYVLLLWITRHGASAQDPMTAVELSYPPVMYLHLACAKSHLLGGMPPELAECRNLWGRFIGLNNDAIGVRR